MRRNWWRTLNRNRLQIWVGINGRFHWNKQDVLAESPLIIYLGMSFQDLDGPELEWVCANLDAGRYDL